MLIIEVRLAFRILHLTRSFAYALAARELLSRLRRSQLRRGARQAQIGDGPRSAPRARRGKSDTRTIVEPGVSKCTSRHLGPRRTLAAINRVSKRPFRLRIRERSTELLLGGYR